MRRVFWFTVLLLSLGVAVRQITDMIANWNDRPFDIVESTVDKHDIEFPAVTVCAEGSNLWPALEGVLRNQKLDPEKFPVVLEAFVRIQWKKIGIYYTLSYISNPKVDKKCLENPAELGMYCNFATLLMRNINRKIANGSLGKSIVALYEKFAKKGKLYGEDELEGYKFLRLDQPQPLRRFYRNKKKIWEANYHTWMTVRFYVELILLQTLEDKVKNKKLDVMDRFLHLTSESGLGIQNISTCSLKSIFKIAYVVPDLYFLIKEKDLSQANKQWSESMEKVPYNVPIDSSYINCKKNKVHEDFYTTYIQLVYLQTFDFSENVGSNIAMLASHNPMYDLPVGATAAYMKEIDEQMKDVAGDIFMTNNVSLSIRDLMETMTTTGIYTMKEKATWNQHLERTESLQRQIDNKSTSGSLRFSLARQFSLPENYPSARKQWTSLSSEDEECFKNIDVDTDFSMVCSNLPECINFCTKMDKLLKGNSRSVWQKLLIDTSHPAAFEPTTKTSRQVTWLVPFCFYGGQLYNMINKLKLRQNFEFDRSKPYYGYKFCKEAKQVITDDGVCTTFNFPDYSDFYTDSMNVLNVSEEPTTPWKEIYPEKTISWKFEEGIALVLDSWAFEGYHTRSRDEKLLFNKRGTPLESSESNQFKVILHDKNEVANFYSHETSIVSLTVPSYDKETQLKTVESIKAFKVRIDAELKSAETDVKGSPVSQRGCKFEDETSGLMFFKKYSKQNCLFECKIKVAKKHCSCVPWNYPATQQDKVCNIFGNVCFLRELIRLKRDIWSPRENLGTPPCGCYPSCKRTRYVTVNEIPTFQEVNFEWLELYLVMIGYKKFIGMDLYNISSWKGYAEKENSDQFLFNYVTDVFRYNKSILNPGRCPLTDLQVSRFSYDLDIKKETLDGRARNLALLYIDFDKQEYLSKRLVVRVTLADMISALGGTLGLFTGFSIVALVDVCFWCHSTMKGVFCGQDKMV